MSHDDLEMTPERKQIIITWGILSRMTPDDQKTLIDFSESLPAGERDDFLNTAAASYARRSAAGESDPLFDAAIDAIIASIPDPAARALARECAVNMTHDKSQILDCARQIVADYHRRNNCGGGGGDGGDDGTGAPPALHPSDAGPR